MSVVIRLEVPTDMHCAVISKKFTPHFCISAEMPGPKDRSVRTYGPNSLSIRIELSQCRNVLVTKCHWCRSVLGPKKTGSDVSLRPNKHIIPK